MNPTRAWATEAVRRIEADFNRSADTHLLRVEMPSLPGIDLYLKDESVHPTGSLKHRLARSLFLYGICNGWIREGTTVIEASSGSTAVSEAYFARLVGLPFVAVVPRTTSPEKIQMIEFYGGCCHFVEAAGEVHDASLRLAEETNGHFMDQFAYAERATDWRGNNNIAESIFAQMEHEPHPIPSWVVCSAGTGGTSATVGRYVRYCCHDTRLCVVDPDGSVFHDFYETGDRTLTSKAKMRIEGIGRPRVERSFLPSVVDRMLAVPDAASVATLRVLERVLGRRCGGSTGTNVYGACRIIAEMATAKESGSVVTLLCDRGSLYEHTYYDDAWVEAEGLDLAPYEAQVSLFFETGRWEELA